MPSFKGATNAATALFVVWACRNDIGVYLLLSDDAINTRALTNASGWSNLWVRMTRNISNSVVRLHQRGARTVIVPDVEEVQRMPFYNRISDAQTAQLREQLKSGNRALGNTLAALDASLPNLRLLRLDLSRRWLEFLDQAVSLGFTRVDTGATLDPALKDKSYTGPGKDYVFWDWAHTTTRTHAVWAEWFNELATQTRTESLRLVTCSNAFDLEMTKLKPGRNYSVETSHDLTSLGGTGVVHGGRRDQHSDVCAISGRPGHAAVPTRVVNSFWIVRGSQRGDVWVCWAPLTPLLNIEPVTALNTTLTEPAKTDLQPPLLAPQSALGAGARQVNNA